jgi:uncharacterized protein (DUF427 family)
LDPCDLPLKIVFNGETVAEADTSYRVLETSHPPVYYLPPNAVNYDLLQPVSGTTFCEWKGSARYFDLVVGERRAPRVAWCYPDPVPAFAPIKDYLAFYAEPLEACYVNGERVQPQPGNFYGGWITSWIEGPFKGIPGSMGW